MSRKNYKNDEKESVEAIKMGIGEIFIQRIEHFRSKVKGEKGLRIIW
jgi:hypothetical protein